jgi:hypothetical protein
VTYLSCLYLFAYSCEQHVPSYYDHHREISKKHQPTVSEMIYAIISVYLLSETYPFINNTNKRWRKPKEQSRMEKKL